MMKLLIQWLAATLLACSLGSPALAQEFLEPEQAFALRAELRADGQLALHWSIAPQYHLYRERIALRSDGAVLPVLLPAGTRKYDENFGKEMETYTKELALQLPWKGDSVATLSVAYQGCADAGLCYPPTERPMRRPAHRRRMARRTTPRWPSARCEAAARGASARRSWPSACCSRSRPAYCRWYRSCPPSSSAKRR
jgi:thiol:disulfide interchange protein DsbD